MLAVVILLFVIYKIGGIFYMLQSVVLIINIICTEYIMTFYSNSLIPQWIRIVSYIILYIIIILLLNDLIKILWTQWV